MKVSLIIHERLGTWARQIRPRVSGWPVQLLETRSSDELESAVASLVCPIVVIGIADGRIRQALQQINTVRNRSSGALILVVDAPDSSDLRIIACELGATQVLTPPVLPPHLMGWLERWLPVARERTAAAGWSLECSGEPKSWEALLLGDAAIDAAAVALL